MSRPPRLFLHGIRVVMEARVNTPDIAELNGLTIAEVLDLIYRRAIKRAAPKLGAYWARHERREQRHLAERTRITLDELEGKAMKAKADGHNTEPSDTPVAPVGSRKRMGDAQRLLDAGQCVSLTFGIGSAVRAQLNVAVPRRHDCQTLVQKALGRELAKAAEPLVTGFREDTIKAEGALSLQPPRQIPPHLFSRECTVHRQGGRLIVHDQKGKPALIYSAVRLTVSPREQLPMGKAVRKALDDKRVPLGSTSKKMLKPVREWLSENGYPTPEQDEALMAHIRRQQKARNEEAKR
jgi:hypothetical protein